MSDAHRHAGDATTALVSLAAVLGKKTLPAPFTRDVIEEMAGVVSALRVASSDLGSNLVRSLDEFEVYNADARESGISVMEAREHLVAAESRLDEARSEFHRARRALSRQRLL